MGSLANFRPPLPPKVHKIPDDERVKQVFKGDEWAGIIGGFPVADGAREAIGPVEREEEQRAIAVVGEDVDNGVKLGADGEPEKR